MKIAFRILCSIFIIGTIVLIVISINQNEWGTTTASLSLIIAIISAWIAFESFRNIEDQKNPSLTITPDFSSRYKRLLLRLRNHGQYPAYNVKIDWDNQPTNCNGEKVVFNKYRTGGYEVFILSGKEETTVTVDSSESFFARYKDKSLIFSGVISYSLKSDSKNKKKEPFEFSLEHYAGSPSFDNEEIKTYYALQQLPNKLEEIKREVNKLRNK